MFRDKLTSTLHTSVVKLLRKGLKDPTLTCPKPVREQEGGSGL